jgi:hypothetical protein
MMNITRHQGLIGLAALAAVGAGLAAGILLGDRSTSVPESASPSPTASVSPIAETPPAGPSQPAMATGTVEGSLVYPAEAIPPDLRVCAVNLDSSRETCTADRLRESRFKNGQGYRLTMAPGRYQIFAVVPSFNPNYRAYYSRFVTCGYAAGCSDHAPITVAITAGQTLTGIEPGDFYK